MKTNKSYKQSLLCTAAIGMIAITGANISQDAKAQSEIVTAETVERDAAIRKLEKIDLQVKIVRNDDAVVAVSMQSLSEEGLNAGMDKMLLESVKASEIEADGTKTYNLSFDKATKVDEESGEKKETPLATPFPASLVPVPTMENGDEFELEVDPVELVAAWERLNQKEEEEEEEEEVATLALDESDKSGSSTADQKDEEPRAEFESPDFSVEADGEPVITTQLCPIKVDIAQQVAIVMEETLVDGVSEGGCQETLTRYPLERRYANCPLTPDIANMVMNESYTLVYNDPNAGEVQAQGCTVDPERVIALTETTEGCGISHDFNSGISTQQTQLTYEHMGVVQTLQACQNSATTFAHNVTRDGCSPIVDNVNSTVTFTERVLIDVDGMQQEIAPCAPNAATTVAINEEECTGSNRYSHDFLGGQSFLNKTYYYEDNGVRTDVITCQPSTETFVHNIDESLCSDTHDDVGKTTTMRGRPVIDDGGQVVIGSCEDISPVVPYVDIGAEWKINTSSVSNLQLDSYDSAYLSWQWSNTTPNISNWAEFQQVTLNYQYYDAPKVNPPVGGGKYFAMNKVGPSTRYPNRPIPPSVQGQRYCINNEIKGNWEVSGGIVVDKANSTSTPQFTGTVSKAGTIAPSSYAPSSWQVLLDGSATWNCSQPTCQLTTLFAHPIWQRGDLSEFVDTSTTLDVKYLCGDGSNLDGTTY